MCCQASAVTRPLEHVLGEVNGAAACGTWHATTRMKMISADRPRQREYDRGGSGVAGRPRQRISSSGEPFGETSCSAVGDGGNGQRGVDAGGGGKA